jgi:Phosphate-selective porin O and P
MKPTTTNNQNPLVFKKLALALSLIPCLSALPFQSALAQTTGQDGLVQRLDMLQKELDRLKGELTELKASQSKTQAVAEEAKGEATLVKTEVASLAAKPVNLSGTTLGGYGEMSYNRYSKNPAATQFNVRRIVLGVNHRFNDRTKLVTEFEFENAVTSASDRGEVAIEQAYIEHQISQQMAIRAGLFIIPMGFLNERHEPFAYYGVDRNFVETAIIPTTWREGGLMLTNNFDNGVSIKGGIATGWDIGKWDANNAESKESPLRTLHQEGQFAKSKDLNLFGAVEWRGYPGLMLGSGIFSGKAGHKSLTNSLGAPLSANPNITLWDIRARYNPGKLDLSALFAKGSISQTAQLNIPFAGSLAPIPSSFQGGYVQAAYNVWSNGGMKLLPFARLERFNTGKGFNLPAGLARSDDPTEQVTTLGANFHLTPTVVVKADVQNFKVNKLMNRFNLGLGYSF